MRKRYPFSQSRLLPLDQNEAKLLARRLAPLKNDHDRFAERFFRKFDYEPAFSPEMLWHTTVYECEWALACLKTSTTVMGIGDENEIRDEYFQNDAISTKEIKKYFARMLSLDAKFGFSIGHIFEEAICDFLSEYDDVDLTVPDANEESGGYTYSIPGRHRVFCEFQLARRIGFNSDKFLRSLIRACTEHLDQIGSKSRSNVGCIVINKKMSRRSIKSFVPETIGLSARLSYRFREYSSGKGIIPHHPGLPFPEFGNPAWKIVADCVNAALRCNPAVSEESLRQRWNQLKKYKDVQISHWPQAGLRQSVREESQPDE